MHPSCGRLLESIVYRACGLPLLAQGFVGQRREPPSPKAALREAYLGRARRLTSAEDLIALVVALAVWPVAVPICALALTLRNGRIIAARTGRTPLQQYLDQIRLALREGILPPWYYIFELFEAERRSEAALFITRWETKRAIYPMLRDPPPRSPLADKAAFARHCERHGVASAPLLAVACGGVLRFAAPDGRAPAHDLFIKPATGRGGAGAEAWSYIGRDRFQSGQGEVLGAAALAGRLARRSRWRSLVVQPRLVNDPRLGDLACGALATARILTCLSEEGQPEIMGAVFRMPSRAGAAVDNFHAGGVAAHVDLETGRLSSATDLGLRAAIGWRSRHPASRAPIEGRVLPHWPAAKALAIKAHRAFADHVLVGWDIALLADGPCVVEGNGGPDLDIMQRPARTPAGDGRLAQLCAYHLGRIREARQAAAAARLGPTYEARLNPPLRCGLPRSSPRRAHMQRSDRTTRCSRRGQGRTV
jgi:hypothetical protein